jgi:hypothetical protein
MLLLREADHAAAGGIQIEHPTVDTGPADKVRSAVQDGGELCLFLQRELAAAEDEVCLQLLQADGVDVVQGRQLDHAAFQACVADVVANETCHLDPALLAAWREDG